MMSIDRAPNRLNAARNLRTLTPQTLSVRDFLSPSDREDLYRFTIRRSSHSFTTLAAEISNLTRRTNVDVELFAFRGTRNQVLRRIGKLDFSTLKPSTRRQNLIQKAKSTKPGSQPEALRVALTAGEYVLRVYYRGGTTAYTLTLKTLAEGNAGQEPPVQPIAPPDLEPPIAPPVLPLPPSIEPPSDPSPDPIVDPPPDELIDPPPQAPGLRYGEALQKSLLFYEAQRSGDLSDNHRIDWRGDSALTDGEDVGIDLTGGYYDAGDHVKFGFPMATTLTMLSWGAIEYQDAYQHSGQLDEILDAIQWGTDYILKAHVTDDQGTKEFWGQVGNGERDHAYWGAPETMTLERPADKIDRQNPGSDLAGEAAAALASASIVFRSIDPLYAERLLDNAIQLFQFANTYQGSYSDAILDAQPYYNSFSGYTDELMWSAIWLYKATGTTSYLTQAESLFHGISPTWTHTWDDKSYGSAVLLAQETNGVFYRTQVEQWLDYWSDTSGGGIQYTDGGLAWLDSHGSLRYTANTAFLAGLYSDTVYDPDDRYTNFAKTQIDYMLGENPSNFSYVAGFGDNFPKNPHHRAASGTTDVNDPTPNLHILYGALVGGPTAPDDAAYVDDRTNYFTNEVALDYNAAFTGALARLYRSFGGDPLTQVELDDLPGISVE